MKKNILFILPDQMRADFIGSYGADFAVTPNIDALAQKSVQYNNAISPSPICVPARASLMTGHNAVTNGVVHNSVWLRPDHDDCGMQTWPAVLSDAGYKTIGIGKMHFYPWDIMEGFDERIISEDKRHVFIEDDYDDYLKENGLKKYHGLEFDEYTKTNGAFDNPLAKEHQGDRWIADKACDYIKSYNEDKPFAMMVGFVSPHCPYDADADFAKLFKDEDMPEAIEATDDSNHFREQLLQNYMQSWCGLDYSTFTPAQKATVRRYYSGLITQVDEGVGMLIETLKEKGIYDDTVIIFSSDHGDFVGDYGYVGKHLFYNPAIHVPLMVCDKDLSPAKVDSLVSLTDIRATMLHIAGVEDCETPDSKCLPCYKLPEGDSVRGIFGATDLGFMYCTDDFKFCKYQNGLLQLFNRKTDPKESQNLANDSEYAGIVKDMEAKLNKVIVNAIIDGNAEKTVDFTTTLTPGSFFKRNWERPYPMK